MSIYVPMHVAHRLRMIVENATALKAMLALLSLRRGFRELCISESKLGYICGVTAATIDHTITPIGRIKYVDFGSTRPVFESACLEIPEGKRKRYVRVVFSEDFINICAREIGQVVISDGEFLQYRSRGALMMRLRFSVELGNKRRIGCHFVNDEMFWLTGMDDKISTVWRSAIVPGCDEINGVCAAFTTVAKDRRRGIGRNARIGRVDFIVQALYSKTELAMKNAVSVSSPTNVVAPRRIKNSIAGVDQPRFGNSES